MSLTVNACIDKALAVVGNGDTEYHCNKIREMYSEGFYTEEEAKYRIIEQVNIQFDFDQAVKAYPNIKPDETPSGLVLIELCIDVN